MADNKPLQEETSSTADELRPSSSTTLKRNANDNEKEGSTDTTATNNKRPKVVLDDPNSTANANEAKSVVTPTATTVSSNETTSAASSVATATTAASSSASTATKTDTLDLAETLGLKVGDEIEVQWEIHNDTEEVEDETDDDKNSATAKNEGYKESDATVAVAAADTDADAVAAPSTTTVTVHWWKATLLEHDGGTIDSVAVRSLLYDARPDLGFPEPSKEDVVFLGQDILVASSDVDSGDWENNPDAVRQMPYRRVHDNQEEEVFYYNDDQLDEQLNGLLMGALNKNQQAWRAMPAAQQAVIAEMIQQKKEQLKEVLRSEARHKVITSETIKDILAKTF